MVRRRIGGVTGWILWLAAIALLTLLTEIGGLLLALATIMVVLVARRRAMPRRRRALAIAGLFVASYGLSLAAVPPLAAATGRVALPCFATAGIPLGALTPLTCLLHRHYATPGVEDGLAALADAMAAAEPGTETHYLDAGFPFGLLPLLPHLSHGDGRKVDLAFFYADDQGYRPGLSPSPIGYWGFERPMAGEPLPCAGRDDLLTLRWDMAWLQPLWPEATLDRGRTAAMVRWLTGPGTGHGVTRLLLEPYLAARLGVAGPMVRFQGCRAARHDDHVHVEFAR